MVADALGVGNREKMKLGRFCLYCLGLQTHLAGHTTRLSLLVTHASPRPRPVSKCLRRLCGRPRRARHLDGHKLLYTFRRRVPPPLRPHPLLHSSPRGCGDVLSDALATSGRPRRHIRLHEGPVERVEVVREDSARGRGVSTVVRLTD